MTLSIPKLREQTFQTAIIERYRRRESSIEEALVEMYLAGVSTRRVADITEALWDTLGEFINHFEAQSQCVRAYREVAEQAEEGEFPYVFLTSLKRRWGGEVGNVSGINSRIGWGQTAIVAFWGWWKGLRRQGWVGRVFASSQVPGT